MPVPWFARVNAARKDAEEARLSRYRLDEKWKADMKASQDRGVCSRGLYTPWSLWVLRGCSVHHAGCACRGRVCVVFALVAAAAALLESRAALEKQYEEKASQLAQELKQQRDAESKDLREHMLQLTTQSTRLQEQLASSVDGEASLPKLTVVGRVYLFLRALCVVGSCLGGRRRLRKRFMQVVSATFLLPLPQSRVVPLCCLWAESNRLKRAAAEHLADLQRKEQELAVSSREFSKKITELEDQVTHLQATVREKDEKLGVSQRLNISLEAEIAMYRCV